MFGYGEREERKTGDKNSVFSFIWLKRKRKEKFTLQNKISKFPSSLFLSPPSFSLHSNRG